MKVLFYAFIMWFAFCTLCCVKKISLSRLVVASRTLVYCEVSESKIVPREWYSILIIYNFFIIYKCILYISFIEDIRKYLRWCPAPSAWPCLCGAGSAWTGGCRSAAASPRAPPASSPGSGTRHRCSRQVKIILLFIYQN